MITFRRNCKIGERRSQGTKGAQKHANSLACESFAAKIAPMRKKSPSTKLFHSQKPPSTKSRSCCETGLPLQNHFAAQAPPLVKIFVVAKPPLGTRVPFRSPNPYFAAAKRLQNPPKLHFTAAKPPLGTWVPFRSPTLPFHNCKMGCKMVCEIAPWLRNRPLATKWVFSCKNLNRHLNLKLSL